MSLTGGGGTERLSSNSEMALVETSEEACSRQWKARGAGQLEKGDQKVFISGTKMFKVYSVGAGEPRKDFEKRRNVTKAFKL